MSVVIWAERRRSGRQERVIDQLGPSLFFLSKLLPQPPPLRSYAINGLLMLSFSTRILPSFQSMYAHTSLTR